jgi:DNA repair protein RecN (Recombination protein N)
MLKQLFIQNYALIEEAVFTPGGGLTVITGETGSGKSILLGALGLVLGERADLDALRSPESKCIVEATIQIDERWKKLFEEEGLDFDRETILRRELSPSGKSRAFINDTPVNLKLMKRFGNEVVDIHSQMETSRLRDRGYRFELLDAAAGHLETIRKWQSAYDLYLAEQRELEALKEAEAKSKLDLDYFRFQLEELDALRLDEITPEELEQEADLHRNAEAISEAQSRVALALDEDDRSVVSILKELIQSLDKVSDVHPLSASLRERLVSASIELQDIAAEAADARDDIDQDPQRLHELESLLDKLYAVQTKHRLQSLTELRELRDELHEKISGIDTIEDRIQALEQQLAKTEKELRKEAEQLHTVRAKAAKMLGEEISKALSALKMPHAELRFELEATDELNRYGLSDLRLMFKANKGGQSLPLEKAASGGERSRVMLALKGVLTRHYDLPTLILDEIDTGVSGEVAARMAEMMKEMAGGMQLIAISHLPQVAGKAHNHYKVLKEVSGQHTYTRLQELTADERIEELASMLSGEAITDSAREHAKALMAG